MFKFPLSSPLKQTNKQTNQEVLNAVPLQRHLEWEEPLPDQWEIWGGGVQTLSPPLLPVPPQPSTVRAEFLDSQGGEAEAELS